MSPVMNCSLILLFVCSLSQFSQVTQGRAQAFQYLSARGTVDDKKCSTICSERAKRCEKDCLRLDRNTCKNCKYCSTSGFGNCFGDCLQDKNNAFSRICSLPRITRHSDSLGSYFSCGEKIIDFAPVNHVIQCQY